MLRSTPVAAGLVRAAPTARARQTSRKMSSQAESLSQRDKELLSLSLSEAVEHLKSGKTSSVELTSACAKQMSLSKKYNAYITETVDIALERAKQADAKRAKGESAGVLGGVPIAIKDNFCTKGIKTTAGSAISVGKTNMDEFGMGSANIYSAYGATISPWSAVAGEDVSAGGSSGGSAAALASSTCFAAVGSDTGGSIRLPASWCGVVGLKPTYGLSSRYGLIQYASSLDTPALLTKTTKDARLLLDLIAGEDKNDSTSVGKPSTPIPTKSGPLTIGIPREYFVSELPADMKNLWEESIRHFQAKGHKIVDISLPHTAEALSAYYVIAPAEASSNLARYDGVRYGYRAQEGSTVKDLYTRTRTEGFGSEVQRRILMGTFALSRKAYESYYKKALQIRRLVSNDFENVFSAGVDVILTPTSPTAAPSIARLSSDDPVNMYMMDVMTIPANLAGLPAISVPAGSSKKGLPVGFQLLAARFNESTLLNAAEILETSWASQRPTLPL